MSYTDILEVARVTAGRLGIRIKDPALVLQNMKSKTGITTILYNKDYTLWIDKHYIAYSDNFKPGIVYVFADEEHVGEELRSVIGRIRSEKSPYALKTLMSVKQQLELARAAMRQSDSGLYFFEEIPHTETEERDVERKSYIVTLCPKCRAAFENTGENYIRRVNPNQEYKEKCTYCNVRDGYDYEVVPKGRKEKR